MMRDIQLILSRWGVWSRQRLGTEYYSVAAGFKGLLPSSTPAESCSDKDAMIVDSCVAKLKMKRPEEFILLHEHYIKDISKREIGRRMRLSEGMVRIKFLLAEGFIEGCLSAMEVELEQE